MLLMQILLMTCGPQWVWPGEHLHHVCQASQLKIQLSMRLVLDVGPAFSLKTLNSPADASGTLKSDQL